jgi:5'-methylthioadenosine phosphorylase
VTAATAARADIAVIGGSGFYSFLEDTRQLPVHTPYGPPSAPVTIGMVGDRPVAFLPRHGMAHEYPPHRVNYRANMWALRTLGVRRIVAPCAVGSLRPAIAPGDFVILDQLVDRTSGRPDTYVDGPVVGHVSFADPYCPELRAVLAAAQREAPTPSALRALTVHHEGTVVVIQGPRFSTRAESRWFRSAGWDVVNMTQYPEAYLARELGMCYCGLALVTDYDTGLEGVDGIEPVTMQQVFDTLAANVSSTRELLFAALPAIPATPGCGCGTALASGPLGAV